MLRKTQLEFIILIIMLCTVIWYLNNHKSTLQKTKIEKMVPKKANKSYYCRRLATQDTNSSVTSTENYFTGHSNIQISKNEKVNRKAI